MHEQRFCNGCYHYYDVKTKELVKNISGSGNLAVYINGLCDGLIEAPEKQVLEYLRGNIEVTYEKTYVDSNLVRIDTIIKHKK